MAQQVRARELAFAEALANRDRAAFAAFIDPEAVFVGGGETLRGREAILRDWAPFFEEGGPTLAWWPETVEAHGRDGLAISTGPYRLTQAPSAPGGPRELVGTYFSVWSRAADGSWHILFDGGTRPTLVQ